MILIGLIIEELQHLLEFLNTPNKIIIIGLILIGYQILAFLLRDISYIRAFKKNKDPESIKLEDLQSTPLLNIIIPAWKEDEKFRDLLNSIRNLNYPHLKVVVNAGGNDETIEIANSFRKFENFIILRQEGGKDKAALGKIKALNECLIHVSEGLLFLTDADCYLTDEILLRLMYPIVNYNENVVIGAGMRPLPSQEQINLVKYMLFSRFSFFRVKSKRYHKYMVSGADTCMKYEVIKSIGKFTENRVIAEDISRGMDVISKGYQVYWLSHYGSRIYTDYPETLKELMALRRRYVENYVVYSFSHKKLKIIIKFILMIIVSVWLLIFPIFLFFHLGLFFISLFIFFSQYLNKIRRYIFFRILVNKKYYPKISLKIFILLFYYIYMEILMNIRAILGLYSYRKKLKELL